jgi:hypothetical protein
MATIALEDRPGALAEMGEVLGHAAEQEVLVQRWKQEAETTNGSPRAELTQNTGHEGGERTAVNDIWI